ncbi:MAG: O-antigen ligase family protein [Candidatus Polarisedimenticolia bacterium]
MTAVAQRADWWRQQTASPPAPHLREAPGGRGPLWALLGFTLVLLIAPQAFFPVLAPMRLGMTAAGLALAAYLYDRFTRSLPVLILTRETWLALALLAWALVTLPFSWWPMGSISFMLEIFAKSVIVFWLVGSVVTSPWRLAATACALSLMAIPLAVTAIKNQVGGIFLQPEVSASVKRIAGYDAPLTGNPNDLAAILNLILPLTTALALGARGALGRAVLWGLVALESMGVIATFSRAGFLTLGFVMMVYGWKLYRRGRLPWVLALVLMLAMPLGPSGYLAHMSTITDVEADSTGSSQQRWGLLVTAARFAATHPVVGTGIGLNVLAMNEGHAEVWREVHNAYLQYAVELGLPGVALFVALLGCCLARTRRAQDAARALEGGERLFLLAEGIQVSLLAYALTAMFHPLAYHFHFYYFAGLAVGLGAATPMRPASRARDAARAA